MSRDQPGGRSDSDADGKSPGDMSNEGSDGAGSPKPTGSPWRMAPTTMSAERASRDVDSTLLARRRSGRSLPSSAAPTWASQR